MKIKLNPRKLLFSPYILFLITLLTISVLSWLSIDRSEGLTEFITKPEKPQITAIAPLDNINFNEKTPIFQFVNNTVPQKWLYIRGIRKNSGNKLAISLQKDPHNQSIFKKLKPLPTFRLIKNSYPDFTDAINLKNLITYSKYRSKVRSLFYTVVKFDEPQLVRVTSGVAGFNVNANIWVGGISLKDGQLIKVNKGLYPLLVEAYVGNSTKDNHSNIARLATRFNIVTEKEVEDVYQWQLARWQKTINASPENDEKLLASIKFDSNMIRGQEGFFRVGKSVNGKWWFIDSEGKAFYYKGCTGLNAGGMGGRRANLPPVSDKTAKKWVAYLKEWGFNGMGSWTTPEFFNQGMAFTEIIETFYEKPWLQTKFPDVWDSRWIKNIDAKCKKLCKPLKNNKMLLGYFLDNERGFMEILKHNETIIANAPTYKSKPISREQDLSQLSDPSIVNLEGMGLLQFSLSLSEEVPAAQKAWDFVLKRYESLESLGKAWQIEVNSKDAFKNLTKKNEVLISPIYLQDLHDFIKLWVEQYYKVVKKTIHKYDPNHLLLGTRWGGIPGDAVIAGEKEWADVVSLNTYRANFYERFDDFYQRVEHPILNGEISTWTGYFKNFRNPIEPPGGYKIDTRQAIRAEEAFDRIFSHPGVVGYTKYRWHGPKDKLWFNNTPQFQVINPLRRFNTRAVSIATSWDQPSSKSDKPLHGQIFMTLQGGKITIKKLPNPSKSDLPEQLGDRQETSQIEQPSLKLKGREIVIGMVCHKGIWDKKVYGDGIQGEIIESNTEGELIKLKLKIVEKKIRTGEVLAIAEYTINLKQNNIKLEGTYEGNYKDYPVEGRAVGYIYRPIPTVMY